MAKEYTVSYRRYEGTSPLAPDWKKRNRRPDTFHPLIRLSGRWLTSLGFPLGSKVEVEAEPGRLVLTALDEIGPDPVPVSEVCEPEGEESEWTGSPPSPRPSPPEGGEGEGEEE